MQHNGTRRPHAVVAERELIRGYHEGGNPAALEELVERYLPLVHQCARRYRHTKEPIEDLVQVASEGLLKALERFDADRGTAFTTYAVPTILGAGEPCSTEGKRREESSLPGALLPTATLASAYRSPLFGSVISST